jgi:hypothetical protein
MPHAYLIIREFMPSSDSVSTSYSIRTSPHAVYHSLENAKRCLKALTGLIMEAEKEWTVEVSHTRQVGEDVLTGFTVLDKRRLVAQVAYVEKVEFGDECGI